MRSKLIALGTALLCAGCGPKPPPPVTILHPVPPELALAGEGIRIVDGTDVSRILKVISATDCQKMPTDPPAEEQFALALLKQEAAKISANAIAKLAFSHAPVEGCLAAVKAGGLAVMAF